MKSNTYHMTEKMNVSKPLSSPTLKNCKLCKWILKILKHKSKTNKNPMQ